MHLPLRFGSAWYPEQWPEAEWDRDLARMREAGFDTVRVGEFAWSDLEPKDGCYTFDWLHRAIDRAAAHGIATILCTPTACVPAWLGRRSPEVLRVDLDGTRSAPGVNRQHFDPSSPTYLTECARIAGALARRFGDHPSVVGWQIDNEIGAHFWGAAAAGRFRAWLQHRHGTLEELNRRWGTAVWSGRFETWDDIPLHPHTHLVHLNVAIFDWQNEVWVRYLRTQAEAIRAHLRRPQPISHNFTYDFARQEAGACSEPLDIVGLDPYVSPLVRLDPERMGFYCSIARGGKRAPFWVLETQPGTTGWGPPNTPLPPGELRRMMFHQVGQGADLVSFWQWRASRTGIEQYHGSLVNADGRPRAWFGEIAATVRDLRALAPHLAGTRVEAPVALLWRARDWSLLNRQRFHPEFDAWKNAHDAFGACRRLGLDVDVTTRATDLSAYRLLIAPQLYAIDADTESALLRWVEAGGHLLLGARSGWADADGGRRCDGQPGGALQTALGAHVGEYVALSWPLAVTGDAGDGHARIWAEGLEPDVADCRVRARYGAGQGWLDGRPAWVERTHGRGRIGYLGFWPEPALWTAIASCLAREAGIDLPWHPLPGRVEVSTRRGPQGVVHLVVNHGDQEATLHLPRPLRRLPDGGTTSTLTLTAGATAALG